MYSVVRDKFQRGVAASEYIVMEFNHRKHSREHFQFMRFEPLPVRYIGGETHGEFSLDREIGIGVRIQCNSRFVQLRIPNVPKERTIHAELFTDYFADATNLITSDKFTSLDA